MNLAFSQTFPPKIDIIGGMPTHFVGKILGGFDPIEIVPYYDGYVTKFLKTEAERIEFDRQITDEPNKIHTMRRSIGRWKEGMKIHFEINSRQSNRFQFAPVKICTGTEHVLIKYEEGQIIPRVAVDGMILDADEVLELAINDGFENPIEFFNYFHEDFEGEIVHWTSKRYFDGDKLSRRICDAIAKAIGGKVVLYSHPETEEEMAMIKHKDDNTPSNFLAELYNKGTWVEEVNEIKVEDFEVVNGNCQCGWSKNECPGMTKDGCRPRPEKSEFEKAIEGSMERSKKRVGVITPSGSLFREWIARKGETYVAYTMINKIDHIQGIRFHEVVNGYDWNDVDVDLQEQARQRIVIDTNT